MADIREIIRQKAVQAGIDPMHALTMAYIESKLNPGAVSPTGYKGLFQFGPSEWKTWGGGKDITDPEANAEAFAGYHNEIRDQMKSSLGRDPTPQELYLGWQQGAGGASKLIKNPGQRAGDLVPPANLSANGMSPDMKASDVVNKWAGAYADSFNAMNGLPPSQYVGPAGNIGMQQADAAPANPALGATDVGRGVAQGLLAARATPDWFGMAGKSGAGLLAASMPQESWQPSSSMPHLPAHLGDPQAIALLPDLKRKLGLLG